MAGSTGCTIPHLLACGSLRGTSRAGMVPGGDWKASTEVTWRQKIVALDHDTAWLA